MDNGMKDFIRISKYAGMREDLVQAGGGNSSFKPERGRMIVKASGYQLAEVSESRGYALVDTDLIRSAFFNAESLDAMSEADGKRILREALIDGEKPSIETFLHAVSGKYTLHTHPIVVNALACRKDGAKTLKELFPEAIVVRYATPGVKLAKEYFKAYQRKALAANATVFLLNHGLVVSADSAEEVIARTEETTLKIEHYLGADMTPYRNAARLWHYFPEKIVWRATDGHILAAYAGMGSWAHGFCPDCVVFLGKRFLRLKADFTQADIAAFETNNGAPSVVEFGGELYILADSVKKALEIQSVMSFSAQVAMINKGHEYNLLSPEEQDYLLNWDAEKYRRAMK